VSEYLTIPYNDARMEALRIDAQRLTTISRDLEQKLLPPPREFGHSYVSELMRETNHLAQTLAEMNRVLAELATATYATGADIIAGRRSL
jgi:hypothetical protein